MSLNLLRQLSHICLLSPVKNSLVPTIIRRLPHISQAILCSSLSSYSLVHSMYTLHIFYVYIIHLAQFISNNSHIPKTKSFKKRRGTRHTSSSSFHNHSLDSSVLFLLKYWLTCSNVYFAVLYCSSACALEAI